MPVLSGAQNVVINNSQFIDIPSNGPNGPSGIDILLEASTPEAAYDSGARAEAPRCLPGTREQYVEDICQWAVPVLCDSSLPLLWMKGAGGVGKSAVAQTFAERIKDSGVLGAAYFFSINGRNKHNTFFPSIAYQLSVKFAGYRELVDKKVIHDKTLVNKTMGSQFRGLIIDPLVELERKGKSIGKRVPIIVDGLDECKEADAQCKIISIIAASAREGTTPLCWAFFSRPESHIEATFAQHDVADICYMTTLPVSHDADGDIELYLRSSFNNILRRHNIPPEPQWPSDSDMKTIVKATKGLFIYAATVYRFVAQPDWVTLDEPLDAVLTVISEVGQRIHPSSTPASPFAELDAFYLLIMRRIPDRMLRSIRLLLAYLCLPYRKSGAILTANDLRLSKAGIHTLCAQLNAVVRLHEEYKPLGFDQGWDMTRPFHEILGHSQIIDELWERMADPGASIDFYHKSFADFLSDPDRSGDFCVRTSASDERLFENFLKLRLDYEDSYRFQNSELVLAPNIRDSGSSLSYPYTNELVNSIIKSGTYLVAAFQCDRLADNPNLGLALRQKFVACDFRKHLYIQSSCYPKSKLQRFSVYRQRGYFKYIDGTRLFQSRALNEREAGERTLSDLVVTLKKRIEGDQEAGVIQRHSPRVGLSSRLKSLFRGKAGGKVESGLYLVGRHSKAIFWFWEVNYEESYYRELRTVDLAMGEKIYRAEPFEDWPVE